MTTVLGAILEAWDELRIHKMRVLLSLVGVAVAVAAMTAVLALGQMLMQAQNEMSARWMGRQTLVTVMVQPKDYTKVDEVAPAYTAFAERYQIDYASRLVSSWLDYQTDTGVAVSSELRVVDAPYGVIHDLATQAGDWFGPGDYQRLAPALVVNEAFMTTAGFPADLSGSRSVSLTLNGSTQQFVILGVVPDEYEYASPVSYVLWDALAASALSAQVLDGNAPQLEFWVDPAAEDQAVSSAQTDFQAVAGAGGWVDVYTNSGGMGEQDAYMNTFRTVVLGVGTGILAIGALSLVNISLVTVQQRIREIGIRRAFGATTGRVFFAIMLESVVATFLAGVIGVGIAVAVVTRVPLIEMMMGVELQSTPPFPMGTALTGVLIATAIGALAGLIPGIVATRIKPIEAMRAS